MTEGRNNFWYSETDSPTVFIFVHGIFSDGRSCWTSANKGTDLQSVYWPDLVARDSRLDSPAIFIGGFHTAPDAGDYDVKDAASELRDGLTTEDTDRKPPPIGKDNLVFICHSTGGVVTRYLLERNQYLFLDKRIGLVLIASPSLGSKYASWFSGIFQISRQRLGLQLRWFNENLKDLDDRFRELVNSKRLPGLMGIEAGEHHFIGPRWLRWVVPERIVERMSAGRYFGPPRILRGTDHFSSVKPTSLDHPAHQLLVKFWLDFKKHIKEPLENQKLSTVGNDDSPRLSGSRSATVLDPIPQTPRFQQNHYGHPYQESVDDLVKLVSAKRGQLVTCLGPPGSLKSLLIEEAASRLTELRRVVWINVSSGTSIDTFEQQLKYRSLGEGVKDLAFDDFLYSVPPLFIVVDAFHGYFTDSSRGTPEAFRIWPERLRALTLTQPHVVVLCGSLSPKHLYTGHGKRQQFERGSWNLNPNQLRLRPNYPTWYERLAETTRLPMLEIERLASLAEHQPGVLIHALDAIDLRNSPESAIVAAHRNYADEIAFAAPPCCRKLLKDLSEASDASRDEVARDCREALVGARFLVDSPEGLRIAAPSWVRRWKEAPA